jgi:hypothetical protein
MSPLGILERRYWGYSKTDIKVIERWEFELDDCG